MTMWGRIIMKYDIEGLADELEIGIEDISDLYASYIQEMKEEIAELKVCLKNSDWDMLQRVVHNIKGVSANLGITDVFSEADKFDKLLKINETSESKEYVAKIVNLIVDSEAVIKDFFMEKGFSI